jgi:hypothetical protein
VLKCSDDRKNRVVSAQATHTSGSSGVGGGIHEQRYASERVLPQSAVELRHAESAPEEQRWKRKSRVVSLASRLVPVELAARKFPMQHCELAVVLPGGRRIEVHPDFDTNTFERLVNALERV